ncbi:hypothetical protein DSCW_61660 [Desulfosarcina widdelii]|uniref:Uncharacterized protein n=1 Tax=Desulfosarcina widdelii TaxID=947919 RepID=A0A5K7ZF24_9BACT|nr:hypothetical protein DSCW_61660 [Desulfosarcina widdelii]
MCWKAIPTLLSFENLQVPSKLTIYFQPHQLKCQPHEYELMGLANSHLKSFLIPIGRKLLAAKLAVNVVENNGMFMLWTEQ